LSSPITHADTSCRPQGECAILKPTTFVMQGSEWAAI
jgi:hypothetical protein